MRIFTLLISLFFSATLFAHEDHALGNGSAHAFYHAVFWVGFVCVVFKGVSWWRNRKNRTDKN